MIGSSPGTGSKRYSNRSGQGIKDTVATSPSAFLKTIFSVFGVDITGIFNGLWGGLKPIFDAGISVITGALEFFKSAALRQINPIISVVRTLINLVSSIPRIVKGALETANDLINSFSPANILQAN